MLNFRRLLTNTTILKRPKWIINVQMTQSNRFYTKELESVEKSETLNDLVKMNDSFVIEATNSEKCNADTFPKTISEASQELQREINENTDVELCLTYNCNVCSRRNSKIISKLAYLKGVVIVRCDKCQNTELVADNAKWIDDIDGKKNVEDILAEKAEKAEKIQHVSMQEFFGIQGEAIQGDKLASQKNDGNNIILGFIMGKAQLIKQKLINMITTPQGKK